MVPMEVEDAHLKTCAPTVVMYHKSFQHCEADNCQYRWIPEEMEEPHNLIFQMQCYRSGWDAKNSIIGKIFCQMHTFAFITCLALSKQDKM